MPSFWVTGTTRFESVDIICQIWPIRGYTRSWYTGTGRLKKWLQAPPPLLSPVSSRFIFVFALCQFSRPDYLGAWNRLLLFPPSLPSPDHAHSVFAWPCFRDVPSICKPGKATKGVFLYETVSSLSVLQCVGRVSGFSRISGALLKLTDFTINIT